MDHIGVGASTCIFGILACYISYFVLNWNSFSRNIDPDTRCSLMCLLILLVLLIFLFALTPTSDGGHIDTLSHLGGFISGFFLGLIIPKPD